MKKDKVKFTGGKAEWMAPGGIKFEADLPDMKKPKEAGAWLLQTIRGIGSARYDDEGNLTDIVVNIDLVKSIYNLG